MCTQTDTHKRTCTHTFLSACVKLQGDGCLFVCLHCCFWCVCDTTRPRSLPLRPLIPPVEMKCNGADSIRALPPRETRRIKSHRIPQSLPGIHCCLVVGREIKQWWLIHLALCTLALTQRGWSAIRQALRATKPIRRHDGCFCDMLLGNSVYSFAAIAKTHMLTELVHSPDTISNSQCWGHLGKITWRQMFPDTSGTLRDPSGKYFFSCNGGKTVEEIKTLSFGQYFAWQVEKGESETTSVPAVRLCNLVRSQNRNT